MDTATAVPSFLCNVDDEFIAIEANLSKAEEPSLERLKLIERAILSCNDERDAKEKWKREEISKLKNEFDVIENMKVDLQSTEKNIKKNERKSLRSKEEYKAKLTQNQEEVSNMIERQKSLKISVESLQSQLISKFNAHDAATGYFQKNLHSYLEVNDSVGPKLTFYLLTPEKSDNYFIQLHCNEERWNLVKMQPKLDKFSTAALEKELGETGDLIGLISFIHKEYTKLKDGIC